MNAADIVTKDLEYIIDNLYQEFNELSGDKILITGGAGFLGYYFVQSILYWNETNASKKPISIIILDNFIRGVPVWIDKYEGHENLQLIKHDINLPIGDLLVDCTYIIHAASIASPTYYRKFPIETMDANVQGLRNLLDYSVGRKGSNQIKGFLYMSSSEIYGDPSPESIPTPETYRGYVSCTGPRACYDESKRYGETLCVNFAKSYGIPIKIARPFNNYGPGLKITDGRVIPDFAKCIFSSEDIVIYSDGSPKRTFCYIADAIVGYFQLLVNGFPGEPYNIGVDKPEISVKELAESMIQISHDLFGYSGKVVFLKSEDEKYLEDNPVRRCPDIGKARKHLGYSPGIEFEDGLKRTLIWYKENLSGGDN
jgi:nucleoside-diphosphate-sugar epimerase